jgi:hypothetical protein
MIIVLNIVFGLMIILQKVYLLSIYKKFNKKILSINQKISIRKPEIAEQNEILENAKLNDEIDIHRGDTEFLILENNSKKQILKKLIEKQKNK